MPRRPPKMWMEDCMSGVGSGYNPGAVCMATWMKMSPEAKEAAIKRHESRRRKKSSHREHDDYKKEIENLKKSSSKEEWESGKHILYD